MNLEKFCNDWLDAWTGNQPEKLRAFYSADAFYRDPGNPQGLLGGAILPYFQKLLAKNPDWRWTAEEIIPTAEGCILKWKAAIPVKGTVIHELGLDIVEIDTQGKITRNEVYFDRAALLKAMAAEQAL